jgi:hypothetical protein
MCRRRGKNKNPQKRTKGFVRRSIAGCHPGNSRKGRADADLRGPNVMAVAIFKSEKEPNGRDLLGMTWRDAS